MRLAFSIAMALLPALLTGLWSRRLLRRHEAADFAERLWRHRQRVIQVITLCFVVVLFAAGWHALWLEPLLFVGSLAAGFRLRRTVFEETWTFPAYVAFVVRLYSAFIGFWCLLALTPMLISTTVDPYRWPVGILLGSLLLLWSLNFSRLFPRILRAAPLEGVDLAPFQQRFEQVDERSSAAKPALHQVPMNGGVFVNAAALPNTRRPAVLFWESLLRLLEPAQVGAIYAHEVAHLEQFDRRRLMRFAAAEWTMVLLATILPLLLADRPALVGYLTMLWPLLVLGSLLLRLAGSRRRETDADLRALELCGDADALIRALTHLNSLARLPRRLALAEEERLTHPSLARRLQVIREAAGRPAEDGVGDPADVPRAWPRVIATGDDGRFVVFEPDRVSWLDGVTPEIGTGAEELRRSATSVRTLVYGQLAELRVEPRSSGPVLTARDIQGQKWAVPLVAGSVAEVQQALDTVDSGLAPRTGIGQPSASARTFLRLAAALGVVLSLFPPMVFSLALPALVNLVRLRPASVGAFGAAGIAAALLRLGVIPEPDLGPETRWPVSILLLLMSLAVLLVAVRWAHQDPGRRRDWAWPTALIHGALASVLFAAALVMTGLSGGIDPFSLHQGASRFPGLVLLPVAAAAALLFVPTRTSRALAILAALAAASVVGIGSPAFERAFVRDPLILHATLPEPTTRRLEEIARLPMEAGAAAVRLSPTGQRFAIAAYHDAVSVYRSADRWRVGRAAGPPLAGGELKAADLRFLDERRVLVLIQGAEDDSASWTVEVRALDGDEPPTQVAVLGGLDGARMTVEPTAGQWWVTGSPAGSDSWDQQIRYSGTVGTEGKRRVSWRIPEAPATGYVKWTSAWRTSALATRWTYLMDAKSGWLPLANPGGGAWYELWWIEGEEAHRLVRSRLDPTCGGAPFGPPAALCLAHHRGQGHLWRLTAPAAGLPALEQVARFPVGSGAGLQWTDSAALLFSYSGKLWHWDRASAALEELIVPDRSGFSAVALAPSGVIGALTWSGEETLLILYR